MKLIRYRHENRDATGILKPEGGIVDVSRREQGFDDLSVALSPPGIEALRQLERERADCPLDAVALLPPLAPSARLFCIGINYKSHANETGRDMPPQPSVFLRTRESVVGHGHPVRCPEVSEHFDYEGELAVVIGGTGRNLDESRAMSIVAGYTCFNDGSVRDFQKHSVTAGKNFDESGACGPAIVTADEIPDPTRLMLTTRLDGQEVQRSGTDLLIYPIPVILAYLSRITCLRAGDVIATGTPAGVGARRTPPLWMKPGDVVEVEISGIGTLRNPVGAAGAAA